MVTIRHFRELDVYKMAMDAAMRIFEITKRFPDSEKYSMVDQVRRSSRSVCSNIGEAWRKRRYPAAFVSKLSDSEGESAETQVWVEMALRCGYISKAEAEDLDTTYDNILGKLVRMIEHPEKWTIKPVTERKGGD